MSGQKFAIIGHPSSYIFHAMLGFFCQKKVTPQQLNSGTTNPTGLVPSLMLCVKQVFTNEFLISSPLYSHWKILKIDLLGD